MRGRVVAALALLAFVHEAAAPDPTASAEALFAHAVATVQSDAHPPYATYQVVVSFTNGDRRIVDRWATTEDLTHAAVFADAFSADEREAPTTPHGINIVGHRKFQLSAPTNFSPGEDPGANLNVKTNTLNPERTGDPIGPVAFAVDQNFGLTPPRSYLVAHDVDALATNAEGLATIGRSGSRVARYRVELLDTSDDVAHLRLTPLRDPYRNRLRELWVATDTGIVREAIVQGIGDRAPFDRARWHVTFAREDGGTYIAEEDALEPLLLGGTLENLRISFEHLALLPHSPFAFTFGIQTPVRALRDP